MPGNALFDGKKRYFPRIYRCGRPFW